MFPKLNTNPKKKKKRDYEEYEDEYEEVEEETEDEEDCDEEEEETIRPRLSAFVPKNKTASLPVVRQIEDDELTEDEVIAQIEQAVNTSSSFGKSVPTIRQYLKGRDYGNAAITAKGALLATLVELIPVAESAVRENKAQRGIYQFNSLATQMRELLIDLDGERDLEGLITSIINEALDPQLRTFAQMLVQWNSGVKRSLRGELNPTDYKNAASIIDEQTQALATYVSQMSILIRQDIDRRVGGME